MKILVTGGAGFIGSNLVKRLADDKDNQIIIVDNYLTGTKENTVGYDVFESMKSFVDSDTIVDKIFHLGMPSSSPMYKKNPLFVADVVNDMILLLEYVKKHKIKLVLAATSSIYNGKPTPFKEDMIPEVTDYYTEARYYCERLIELYTKLYNVKAIALRFFSVYGPNEHHKGEFANLVSQFEWDIIADKSPVIYGDGTQRRDLIHVNDIVEALILAMETDFEQFEIFNAGTGETYDLNELMAILNKKHNKDIKAKYIDNPISNYVAETKADTEKAEKILGFKAKIRLVDN